MGCAAVVPPRGIPRQLLPRPGKMGCAATPPPRPRNPFFGAPWAVLPLPTRGVSAGGPRRRLGLVSTANDQGVSELPLPHGRLLHHLRQFVAQPLNLRLRRGHCLVQRYRRELLDAPPL